MPGPRRPQTLYTNTLYRRLGGVSPTGKSFRVVRACARARALVVKSERGQMLSESLFPFPFLPRQVFPFPFWGWEVFPFPLWDQVNPSESKEGEMQ